MFGILYLWRDYCGVARWHDLLATKDMGWLQGETRCDPLRCHALSHADCDDVYSLNIQDLSWSQVVCILVFEFRIFSSHLDIWTVHIRQWDGTCFFFIVHLSSQAPSVDLLDVCCWGGLAMLAIWKPINRPTSSNPDVNNLDLEVAFFVFLHITNLLIDKSLITALSVSGMGQLSDSGRWQRAPLEADACAKWPKSFFRSRMTRLILWSLIAFLIIRTIGGQKHTSTLSPPTHINPETPNLKWHEKGVVARRRKGGGPATCHCSLHFCQGWERTLYPSCRDGNPFVQLGACSMILQWPIISHSQGRPLKDAAWYSNPCVTLLYIISIWFVHVQGVHTLFIWELSKRSMKGVSFA